MLLNAIGKRPTVETFGVMAALLIGTQPLQGQVERQRPVTPNSSTSALPAAVRAYLSACLFEHVSTVRPPWQLPHHDKRASPYLRSDKCDRHSYHYAYSRYVVPLMHRHLNHQADAKVLEIGLGCGQHNVGAGVRMWDRLFTSTRERAARPLTLHVLEYDERCAAAWKDKWASHFNSVNLTIFTGSQSDAAVLQSVAHDGGGGYDAIVDDGGHSMNQQLTSLKHLFHLLQPSGWYAIEDLQTSFMGGHYADVMPTMSEMLGQMINWLNGDPHSDNAAQRQFSNVMPLVEHVDCYAEICVLQRYP